MSFELNRKSFAILLVEDNRADVVLIREALRDADIPNELLVAKDGIEALEILYKKGNFSASPTPDLIILDLNLPRKNGIEVLSEIKNDRDLKMIPVIILTSSRSENDITKTYGLHANSYIAKPIDFENFIQIVKSIEEFWFTTAKLPPRNT